jgi:hypothetical protein
MTQYIADMVNKKNMHNALGTRKYTIAHVINIAIESMSFLYFSDKPQKACSTIAIATHLKPLNI